MNGAETYEYINKQLKKAPKNWYLLSFVYSRIHENQNLMFYPLNKQQTQKRKGLKTSNAASKQFTSAVDL